MAGTKKKGDSEDSIRVITRNKRAFHEYEVMDRIECGIVLVGTEVKSLRKIIAYWKTRTPRSTTANSGWSGAKFANTRWATA